jgi:3-hydroxyacyl-CoA dehydrogenase/enoyl-CoA hydratase/3-hydroxybutyryl-CoA epimerase
MPAALAFGMPMGPIELADTVGLDVAVARRRAAAREGDRSVG